MVGPADPSDLQDSRLPADFDLFGALELKNIFKRDDIIFQVYTSLEVFKKLFKRKLIQPWKMIDKLILCA